jgi:integrase
MPRNRYPAIKKGSDGFWHAWITVGTKANGRPDQRHVKRATKTAVEDRIDELLDQVKSGIVVKAGKGMTVTAWFDLYLGTVLPSSGRCDPDTIRDYRSKLEHWVLPIIGHMRLDRVQTENIEACYLMMRRAGRADSFILKVHRILNRAWKIALRRKLVPTNILELMDPPTFVAVEQEALSLDDAKAVLTAAAGRRNSARWSIGLALGLRQGEMLGLRWEYIDLEKAEMRVWWQLTRRTFDHGCGSEPCRRRKAGYCPRRTMQMRSNEIPVLDLSKPGDSDRRTGLVLKEPKGKSKRTLPLAPELVDQLREHQKAQMVERILADVTWQDHGFVFTEEDGRPIDPKHDYAAWRQLLDDSGVPAIKLHAGRHTAATILIALKTGIEVVQELLGHSDSRTTRGYVHIASEMARAATQRIGSALFGEAPKSQVHPEVHP